MGKDAEDNSTLGDPGTSSGDSGTDTLSLPEGFKDILDVVEIVEVIFVIVEQGIISPEDFIRETVQFEEDLGYRCRVDLKTM